MVHDHDAESYEYWVHRMWHAFLTGEPYDLSSFPFVMRAAAFLEKHFFSLLPSGPRCRDCNVPFRGIGGVLLRQFGYRQSDLTPRLCNSCVSMIKQFEGGAEVELSMLFADVRGSTALAERIGTVEFRQMINRFYRATTDVLITSNALIDKLIGDEVVGLYVPGFAGPDHARVAVEAAQELLRATGHADPAGPWIPVGAGVHTGTAYVGSVGSVEQVSDITALGDSVNTAARLASQAAPGEILVSEAAITAAGLEVDGLEERQLELKGKSEPVDVRVIRINTPELQQ
jgi:adenylate cyclase